MLKTKNKINERLLEMRYKRLLERAYNLRQTDDSMSDIFYYEAHKVLSQLNLFRSHFLVR
ncbi:MAG TPA: Lacal_2735 family protein [Flavobacteriaceae bacterium]|nr:Lacal_2735 family protein [Flavobacteriaceae bacterium]